MAKICIKKSNNNKLSKNKSHLIKINGRKTRMISSETRLHLRKKIKIKKINKKRSSSNSSNFTINNNKENNNNNDNLLFFNIYNTNYLESDFFYSLRCYACRHIPLISIKYNQINIIQNKDMFFGKNEDIAMVQCSCIKGHNINTSLKTYLIYCKIKHNFLTLCEECHESKPYELFDFSFCKECKKTLCLKCSEFHKSKQKCLCNSLIKNEGDKKNETDDKNNKLISINKLDFFCQNHKTKLCSFCKECNLNLCKQCETNHNKSHKLISFSNILLTDEEIDNIEFNIDLARKRLFLFEKKILKFIHSLYKLEKLHHQLVDLYNIFTSIYKDEISFVETTLSIYREAMSRNEFNFQIIQNTRNLKFNIRGIPIKNKYDFTTNIKSLTSFLTNSKNFLLLDVKNYYSNKRIIKARIRASAKRIRSKIYLNNVKTNKLENKGNIINQKDCIDNKIDYPLESNQNKGEISQNITNNNKQNQKA